MDKITDPRADLLAQRYGEGNAPETILWSPQIEGILSHRSVRAYLPDPLPEGAIQTMVAAAQSASSSSNLHLWSVIAVTDPDTKAELNRASYMDSFGLGNPAIEQAPVFLLWIADQSRNHAIAKAEGGSAQVLDHLDAFVMSTVDTALAAQNAALAAESLGLGIVYIGGMRNRAQQVADILGLPDYSYVVFGMVVGHPDPAAKGRLRPRPAQEVVLHRERYQPERAQDLVGYEGPFKVFRDELGMKSKTFTDAVTFATNDIVNMDGRQHLRGMLEARGFKLR